MKVRTTVCCVAMVLVACPGPGLEPTDGGAGGGTGGGATGGGTGGGGAGSTVTGPLGFAVRSATTTRDRRLDGGLDPVRLQVALTSAPASMLCTQAPVATKLLAIVVANLDGGPTVPDTYAVIPPTAPSGAAIVYYREFPADAGQPTNQHVSVSGTVTFTTINSARSVGSFAVNLALPDGGDPSSVMGTFDAPVEVCN